MKKIFYILMVAVGAFAFVSCNDEVEADTPLEIKEAMVAFEAGGGEGSIKLSKSNAKVTSPEEWCKVTVFFNEVTVRVDPNEGMMARHSYLSITVGSETVNVTVSQKGVSMAFDISSLSFTAAASSQDVTVDASTGIAVTVASDQTWVTPVVVGNIVSVTVEGNASATSRSATVTINVGNLARTVSVAQAGMSLALTPASLSFGAEVESKEIVVSTVPEGIPLTGITATSNQTWASTSVDGNKVTVTVSATPAINDRTATITVTGGGIQKTATITQSGRTATMADITGTYTVACVSYFNGSVGFTGVTISQKTGNTVTIARIPHASATYDATFDPVARTISCPDLTLVNGINSGGNLIYVASMSGDPIVMNITDIGRLSTPVPTEQGQFWGYYVNATGNWVDLYNGGTTWTRTAP